MLVKFVRVVAEKRENQNKQPKLPEEPPDRFQIGQSKVISNLEIMNSILIRW